MLSDRDANAVMVNREEQGPASSMSMKALALRRSAWPWIVATLLLWPALVTIPCQAPPSVDQSWQTSLGFFFEQRLQAGRDYVFTTGPLGFFYTNADRPNLRIHRYAWQVTVKLAIAAWFIWLAWRLGQWLPRALWLISILLFASIDPREPVGDVCPLYAGDGLYSFFIVLLGVYLLGEERLSWPTTIAAGLLGILALVKFTFLVLAAAILGVLLFRGFRRRYAPFCVSVVGLAITVFLAGWVLAGQSLWNLPVYLERSLEIALGYPQAMGLPGPAYELWLAASAIALLVAGALLVCSRNQSRGPILIMLVLALFLAWKHGFTRHDGHALSFFTFTMFTAFLIWSFRHPGWRSIVVALASVIIVLLSIAGIFSVRQLFPDPDWMIADSFARYRERLHYLVSPSDRIDLLGRISPADRAKWDWPILRREIVKCSVDLISSVQSALFVNNLNYRQRPVFQSYSTYTPELLEANARALAQARGPDFLVVRLEPIDQRMAMLEDAMAWQEVLYRYRPVTVEKDNLLLERDRSRDGTDRQLDETLLLERSVRFGEEISVPAYESGFQKLTVRFHSTWSGRLRGLLLRPPRVFIHLKTTDNRERSFRLVPAMAEKGFLLSPFVGNYDDILKLYGRPGAARVMSFRITVDEDPSAFDDRIDMRLASVPNLVAYHLSSTTAPGSKNDRAQFGNTNPKR
jgi:hypothetical protein